MPPATWNLFLKKVLRTPKRLLARFAAHTNALCQRSFFFAVGGTAISLLETGKTVRRLIFCMGLFLVKNLFGNDVTYRIKENRPDGSPLFVFYPGKAGFGVVVPRV